VVVMSLRHCVRAIGESSGMCWVACSSLRHSAVVGDGRVQTRNVDSVPQAQPLPDCCSSMLGMAVHTPWQSGAAVICRKTLQRSNTAWDPERQHARELVPRVHRRVSRVLKWCHESPIVRD
jgi:transposase